MWAKIITIKRTKDLNYFSLCALNLFNTWVSQFSQHELNYWNKLTFPRHSNLLRCTCTRAMITWLSGIHLSHLPPQSQPPEFWFPAPVTCNQNTIQKHAPSSHSLSGLPHATLNSSQTSYAHRCVYLHNWTLFHYSPAKSPQFLIPALLHSCKDKPPSAFR